jgi:hypothetical protein
MRWRIDRPRPRWGLARWGRRTPRLGGALEGIDGDVDADRDAGVLLQRVAQCCGVIEQAGAGGGRVQRVGRKDELLELLAGGVELQVRMAIEPCSRPR